MGALRTGRHGLFLADLRSKAGAVARKAQAMAGRYVPRGTSDERQAPQDDARDFGRRRGDVA